MITSTNLKCKLKRKEFMIIKWYKYCKWQEGHIKSQLKKALNLSIWQESIMCMKLMTRKLRAYSLNYWIIKISKSLISLIKNFLKLKMEN